KTYSTTQLNLYSFPTGRSTDLKLLPPISGTQSGILILGIRLIARPTALTIVSAAPMTPLINEIMPFAAPLTMPFIPSQAQLKQRSEEHTSELQSRENLVCRLLL